MKEELMQGMTEDNALTPIERDWLQRSLAAVEAATERQLVLSALRWQGVAAHLVGVIRRCLHGEVLPPVEAVVVSQISSAMQALSRDVLKRLALPGEPEQCTAEVVLLAIHFETARQEQEE